MDIIIRKQQIIKRTQNSQASMGGLVVGAPPQGKIHRAAAPVQTNIANHATSLESE